MNSSKEFLNSDNLVEFQVEKLKLESVQKIIGEEILNSLEQRKKITDAIVEYRKQVVSDYRDDEDQGIEYFDHERYVQEEAFRSIDRKLKELTELKLTPYFGRITFEDKEFEDIEQYYIGRFGLTLDDSYEPIVVDWRAPVASLFYAGRVGDASYKAPAGEIKVDIKGRRQYILKKGQLQGLFDSDIDVKDDILQMVLSSNSGEKLKDIIMTIQKEQDDIIRQDRFGITVVNGVAGSGKTTIALHRVAYLLYNHRKQLEDKVLILGPNAIFMEYIASVLPSLGESDVRHGTFRDFALNVIGKQLNVMSYWDYIECVLNGDEELAKNGNDKKSPEFINVLDSLVDKLNEDFLVKVNDVIFRDTKVISKEEIIDMLDNHFKSMPLYRRTAKVKRIIVSKLKDKRDEDFRAINKKYADKKASMSQEDIEINGNHLEFQRKLEIREMIRQLMAVRDTLVYLDGEDVLEIYNDFNGNKLLIEDDLAPMIYMYIKLNGLKFESDIKHVVIDEAQDYSKLQFIVIKELTGCSSFTVVGDCNQRLDKSKEKPAMLKLEEVFGNTAIRYNNLLKSYRSTKEIMEYANKFLKNEAIVPLVRNGAEVIEKSIHSKDELLNSISGAIEEMKKEGLETIAVVCRTSELIEKFRGDLRECLGLKILDRDDIIYRGGEVVLPSYFAKGLEFDGVIILDSEDVISEEDFIKYIMCTRALHRLYNFNIKL